MKSARWPRAMRTMQRSLLSVVHDIHEGMANIFHGHARGGGRQQRPVAAHRAAGGLARGNRLEHGAADQHGAPERRQRRARRPGWLPMPRTPPCAAVTPWPRGGRDNGRDQRGLAQDRRHHRRDRRHRLPDQHPGAERRRGSSAGRRAGSGASPWWRARCAAWRSAAPTRPRKSRA